MSIDVIGFFRISLKRHKLYFVQALPLVSVAFMSSRILLLLLCSVAFMASAQTPVPTEDKFRNLIMDVQRLQAEGKNANALEKLNLAEELQPQSPIIPNARGSIYTAMRNFDKARECFNKAKEQSPDSFEPKFNLTELNYVQGKYADAEASFSKLLTDFPKIRQEVRHLIQFKVLVCQLKQDKVSEAETTKKAFTFMDDTPAYYFTQAAFAFQKNNKPDAQEWLTKAGTIFKLPDNAAYLDTLMEAHWIDSISVPESVSK